MAIHQEVSTGIMVFLAAAESASGKIKTGEVKMSAALNCNLGTFIC